MECRQSEIAVGAQIYSSQHHTILIFLQMPFPGMQIENEYGFCPLAPDAKYLSFLKDRIHQYLGEDTIIYTTDPPSVINKGTIPGKDVYS